MAYEALIVIGFGVALAVVSVALFCAHVKRINAPNKADPGGTLVNISLGAAIAQDQAAHDRKLAARGSRDLRHRDGVASSGSLAGSTLGVDELGMSKGSSSASSAEAKDVVVKDTLPVCLTTHQLSWCPVWGPSSAAHRVELPDNRCTGCVRVSAQTTCCMMHDWWRSY